MKQIRLKDQASKPGQKVTIIRGDGKLNEATWGGHAKDLSWWSTKGNFTKLGIIADSFVQGDMTLFIPHGTYINAIGFKHDIVANGRKIYRAHAVKALTREARNSFEKSISNSWPRVNDPNNRSQFYEWTPDDILHTDGPHQGDLFDNEKPF